MKCQILELTIGKLSIFPGIQTFIFGEIVSPATEFNISTIKFHTIRIVVST